MYLAWLEQLQDSEVNFFPRLWHNFLFLHPSPVNIIDAWRSQNTWKLFYYLILNREELKVNPYLDYIHWVELEMENIPMGNRDYISRGIHRGSIFKKGFIYNGCLCVLSLYSIFVMSSEMNIISAFIVHPQWHFNCYFANQN